MRPILVVLIFLSSTVLARYHEKTRFDRSIYDENDPLFAETNLLTKEWIFTDYETHFIAYKDKQENDCYLERITEERINDQEVFKNAFPRQKRYSKVLYASPQSLTKLEAWRIAGGRIVDFCHGRNILMLQDTRPVPGQTLDPFFNEIPLDENDIVSRRVADVVLTPLLSRAKRQIMLEERQKLNENYVQSRRRRQAPPFRGRFRGQTQSQYLNVGNDDQKEGKAEAEATQQSSRAIVSGSRGMGQAQSMSLGGTGCEDCPGYGEHARGEGAPDKLQIQGPRREEVKYPKVPGTGVGPGALLPGGRVVYPGVGTPGQVVPGGDGLPPGGVRPGGVVYPGTPHVGGTYPTGTIGGTYPGGVYPGPGQPGNIVYPGTVPGDGTYPGGIAPGIVPRGRGVYPGGGVTYPGGVPPGTGTTTGGVTYPGGVPPGTGTTTGGVTYPGGVPPGTGTTGGGVTYPGGVPPGTGITTGGVTYPGGVPPGTGTTTGGVTYPGGVPPGTGTTGGGVAYPGGVPPGTGTTGGGVTYPGGVPPGTGTTGGGIAYPGGVPPGTGTTGGGVAYPGGLPPGTGTTGGGVTYPGGVPPGTGTTGGGVTYPGGVPPGTGTTGGGIAYPGGVPPGTGTTGGGIAYPGGIPPGTGTTGGGIAYPGGVPPGTGTTGGVTYPGGTVYPGGVTYPGGGRPYPVPGETVTESRANADSVVYPGRHIPQSGLTDGGLTGGRPTYPGLAPPGTVPGQTGGTVTYPGGVVPGTPDGGVIYTGGIPPGGGGVYPGGVLPGGGVSYPGGVPPGTRVTDSRQTYPGIGLPGGTGTGGGPNIITTSGSTSGAGTSIYYPGSVQPTGGQTLYPGGVIQPGLGGQIGTGGTGTTYPGGVYPSPGQIYDRRDQGTGKYQPGGGTGGQVPGYPTPVGQYPGIATWQDGSRTIQGGTQYPTGVPGHVPGIGIGGQGIVQYPGGGTIGGQGVSQYPGGDGVGGTGVGVGQYPSGQYPGAVGPGGIGEVSQYYRKPGGPVTGEDDGSDSQASSSVKQMESGTQASASAQGKYGQGTSQSQVTGTYTGSGSFSAQAGSSDDNKSAQTAVSGGKEGATSNAQGTGGYGKSQAQVQLDSESGATSTGAQSSGWNHGTNSQVQASSKGGMADAQANGEGNTSSQAQIGFQPYMKTDEKVERHSRPFRGGGTASAQSGTYRGQSQSQLEGSFQYGITYTGAAQAGSGSGAAASRKQFNFSNSDSELFKPFKPYSFPTVSKNGEREVTNASTDVDYNHDQDDLQQGLQTSSSSRRTVITNVTKHNSESQENKQTSTNDRSQTEETMYDVNTDYDDEYEDEDYDSALTQSAMNSKISTVHNQEHNNNHGQQSQMIHVSSGNQYDVRVKQDSNPPQIGSMLQPGQTVPGYKIPPGFRGRVTAVSGDETIAQGNGNSQSQSVSLVPVEPNINRESKSPLSETRSLQTSREKSNEHHISSKDQGTNISGARHQSHSREYSKPTASVPIKPSYYTVTNSVAGKMDGNRNAARKYEHRYYTKSSTCGYFTFSCNVVYGSNGRTKICKPKVPTYPDGTPMKC